VIVLGHVERFDDRRGDGVVRGDDGEGFGFHCVAITDGTRQIAPGTRVRARRSVGLRGRDEVSELEKLSETA
jgi:hypothetical protein